MARVGDWRSILWLLQLGSVAIEASSDQQFRNLHHEEGKLVQPSCRPSLSTDAKAEQEQGSSHKECGRLPTSGVFVKGTIASHCASPKSRIGPLPDKPDGAVNALAKAIA